MTAITLCMADPLFEKNGLDIGFEGLKIEKIRF